MHAVSISLGSTSTIVAVATVSATQTGIESSVPVRVIANSSGHRVTPTMAAFAENNEVLFGEDARALYARAPQVVVPYLFAFAAVANEYQRRGSGVFRNDENNDGSDDIPLDQPLTNLLQRDVEAAAKLHYKGHCPFQREDGSDILRFGFRPPHEGDDDDDGSAAKEQTLLPADEMMVMFFDHIKRHTIDGACGLVATAADSDQEKSTQSDDQEARVVLTVVVPRHLFPEAAAPDVETDSPKGANSDSAEEGGTDSDGKDTPFFRRCSSLQWVRNAVGRSHLGSVAAHISVIFADEAVLLGMDTLPCRPHQSHRMAGHHFLLPPTVVESTKPAPAWPSARVLVVDWGALGVSLTAHRLEGGCLLSEMRSRFLRASQTAPTGHNTRGKTYYLASNICGGGVAVDLALRDCLAKNFIQTQRRVLGYQSFADFPARAQRRLLMAVEEKKLALSKAAQVPVEIEALAEGVDLRDNVTFSRTRVNASLRGEWGVLDGFEKVLREYLQETPGDKDKEELINVVVLCGGMLQIPFVAQSLRQLFVQYASVTSSNRLQFSRDLVVMEAGACTTMCVEGNGDSAGSGSARVPHTVEGTGSIGAEELACVGGCLHSYHIALAVIKKREVRLGGQKEGSKNVRVGHKGATPALSWRKQRRAEEANRVWHALTRGAVDSSKQAVDSTSGELLILQRPVFLLLHSGVEELRLALSQQQGPNDSCFHLPSSVLTVLFAAHTALPARVLVPLQEGKRGPIVLYLFTEEEKQKNGDAIADGLVSLSPLTDKGLVLGGPTDGGEHKYYVVFTLRPSNAGNRGDLDGEEVGSVNGRVRISGVSTAKFMNLAVQLVRTTSEAAEPQVVMSSNLQASVMVDL
ncbi:Hsp70 protein, putative [Trypanosoma equiperdum]|uniref:Hsp70 protein, putative n=1 Tax=Trypanosoma equiperdum TaxID=5694 RepID=A0A1G4I3Z2_TRYEQ|nr:Hsp70 protein, putative [Trypanosoma equiperdum]